MLLHNDIAAFKKILKETAKASGLGVDILEKDYYVSLTLKELAEKQADGLPAYFKGGTALYKALKQTNRFSEDIDLSVDTRECSRSQNDRRLENATKKYSSLPRNRDEGRTNRSEIISFYEYTPIVPYPQNDTLQRFGKLKIEATSFTISEPVTDMEVEPLIYTFSTDEQKAFLEKEYDIKPFLVKTMTLERIFIDKLFAAEAYVGKSEKEASAFDAAKHIYDLAVMSNLPAIKALYSDAALMESLLNIRMEEEKNRLDGIGEKRPTEFEFPKKLHVQNMEKAYERMQAIYVLNPADRIEYSTAISVMEHIFDELAQNEAWLAAGATASLETDKETEEEMERD